jgi:1-acyl-sn-glycerol-3-phosphate acyltransferase
MLRFILAVLFAILYLIIGILFQLIVWIIGKFSTKKRDRFARAWVNTGLNGVAFVSGVKTDVIGEENIPKGRPVVYMANHRSFFDAILLYPRIHEDASIMAKIEMLHVPLLSSWMKNVHCLFVDRNDTKQGLETVMKGIDYVSNGLSMVIFPEGTRNHEEGTILPFHNGSFKIAERPGAPVVPVTIVNTGRVWEDHFPKVTPQHVIIEFGKPIETAGLKPAERKLIPEQVRNVMIETYEKNRKLI